MILQTLALICTAICVASAATCPKPEEIAPCECYKGLETTSVHCVGTTVTEDTLKLLTKTFSQTTTTGTTPFNALEIFETSIKSLPENAFGSAKFMNLHINNNFDLEKIDPNAFNASNKVALTVQIQNNPKLTGDGLFELVRNLELVELVRLDHNNITQIPAHAFTPKNGTKGVIETLYLTNNQIKSIGSYAFYGQPVLRVASIKQNLIEQLDDNSLTISKHEGPHEGLLRTVSIYLDYNNITEKSFTNASLANPERDDVSIHMEENHLTSLPQEIFKPFIDSSIGTQLYLLNNKFVCDCSMKWIHTLASSSRIRFNEVVCSDHSNKTIISLTDADFAKCSFQWDD